MAPCLASASMAGPPTPLAWKITVCQPARSSASRRCMTPGVVWPSMVTPTLRAPRPAGGRRGHLLSSHVGDGAGRRPENPRVDHDRLATQGAYPVAHVFNLGALGVQGADQCDARGGGRPDEIFDFGWTPVRAHV